MTVLLVVAVLGQSCIAQARQAGTSYQQVQYGQQAYTQVETRFIAIPAEDAAVYYQGVVGQAYRAEQRQAERQQAIATTDAKIDQLSRLVEQLQRRLETQPNEPPQQQPQPLLPPRPNPVVSPPPPASEAVPPPPTISQASRRASHPGLSVLAKSCASCHTSPSSAGGGFEIFTPDGSLTKLDEVSLDAIESAIVSGRMPKRAPNLTLREYATVRDFLGNQKSGVVLNANSKKTSRR